MSILARIAQHKFAKMFNEGWKDKEHFLKFVKTFKCDDPYATVNNRCNFFITKINGSKTYVFSPEHSKRRNKTTFLYFYGSAHALHISDLHFNYFTRLANLTGATYYVPDLPVCENYGEPFDRKALYKIIVNTYKELLEQNSPEDIIIAGDSSGGGLALLMPTLIKENKLPQPGKIFLMNPLSECDLKDFKPNNPTGKYIFPKPGLQTAIEMYAGKTDLKDPYVSPYYTDFSILPKTYLFYGEYDEALLSLQRLEKKLRKAKKLTGLYIYPKIFHDFFVAPIPEFFKVVFDWMRIIKPTRRTKTKK